MISLFYKEKFNLYIPISYVDENFKRAHKRDAILKEKFFFRKNILDNGPAEIIELTLKDLFLGCDQFMGF